MSNDFDLGSTRKRGTGKEKSKRKVFASTPKSNLEQYRGKLNKALLDELESSVSENESWKYVLTKIGEKEFGIKTQYDQIKAFEEGGSRGINFYLAVMKTLLAKSGAEEITITFSNDGVSVQSAKVKK